MRRANRRIERTKPLPILSRRPVLANRFGLKILSRSCQELGGARSKTSRRSRRVRRGTQECVRPGKLHVPCVPDIFGCGPSTHNSGPKPLAVTEEVAVGGPSLWARAIIFLPAVPLHALHVFQPRKFRCSGHEPPGPMLLRRPKSICI